VGGLQWTTWDEMLPDAFEPAIQNLRRRIEALTGADSELLRLRIGGRLAAEAHQALDDFAAWAQAEHDALVGLVDRILKPKRAKPSADTTALEREIDERVYRLYGLTPEEIQIVEESRK
jgi:hypothetical protein